MHVQTALKNVIYQYSEEELMKKAERDVYCDLCGAVAPGGLLRTVVVDGEDHFACECCWSYKWSTSWHVPDDWEPEEKLERWGMIPEGEND